MNAESALARIARAFATAKLEAVLIGNAGAALNGAPVTTLDFDFMFRATKTNIGKLKRFARELGVVVLRPFYPVSDVYRLMDDGGLQIDFVSTAPGIPSFEGLRARSLEVKFRGWPLRVAALEDIVRSKRAAGRPKDMAVIDVLEKTIDEKRKKEKADAGRAPRGKP